MATQYIPRQSKGMVSPVRRRRFVIGCLLLGGILLFFFFPWEIPFSLRDANISRASIAKLTKSSKTEVGEIYGLLHLVTGDNEQEHVLSNAVQLDPTHPIDIAIYAAGDTNLNWQKERDRIDEEYPVIVFSKVSGVLIHLEVQKPHSFLTADILPVGLFLRVNIFVAEIENFYRFSRRAKELLASYELQPPPKIIEVDIRGDAIDFFRSVPFV